MAALLRFGVLNIFSSSLLDALACLRSRDDYTKTHDPSIKCMGRDQHGTELAYVAISVC